jgi:hypothetical protein
MPSTVPLWVIDTSSLICIGSKFSCVDKGKVYEGLSALVEARRLAYPNEVVNELARYMGKENPALCWAQKHACVACSHRPDYEVVRSVLTSVPEVVDYQKDSPTQDADPYILALAVQLRTADIIDVRIVTEESRNTDKKMCLASAAGYLGLPSMALRIFLKHEGILPF